MLKTIALKRFISVRYFDKDKKNNKMKIKKLLSVLMLLVMKGKGNKIIIFVIDIRTERWT